METAELFDLLERCSSLSIRGNAKAIQQATALLACIQELETFVREVANDDLDRVSGGIKDKAAALLNNTPLEKE